MKPTIIAITGPSCSGKDTLMHKIFLQFCAVQIFDAFPDVFYIVSTTTRPPRLGEVNHKDYNKSNNCVDNLEWVTSSGNKSHAYKKIENHITRGKEVEQYTKAGEYVKTYDTVSDAAKAMGCCVAAISNCCLGRTKTSMGFQWRFSEGSTTKYERNLSSPVQDSSKEDEDIV